MERVDKALGIHLLYYQGDMDFWRYGSEEPTRLKRLLPGGSAGSLVVRKTLSLNLNYSSLN